VIQGGAWRTDKRDIRLGVTVGGPMYSLDGRGEHAVLVPTRSPPMTRRVAQERRGERGDRAHRVPNPAGFGHGWQAQHWECAALLLRRLTPLECERLQGFPDGWTCLCEASGDYGEVQVP
jgi:site-specific DNA-cytosine methylase